MHRKGEQPQTSDSIATEVGNSGVQRGAPEKARQGLPGAAARDTRGTCGTRTTKRIRLHQRTAPDNAACPPESVHRAATAAAALVRADHESPAGASLAECGPRPGDTVTGRHAVILQAKMLASPVTGLFSAGHGVIWRFMHLLLLQSAALHASDNASHSLPTVGVPGVSTLTPRRGALARERSWTALSRCTNLRSGTVIPVPVPRDAAAFGGLHPLTLTGRKGAST